MKIVEMQQLLDQVSKGINELDDAIDEKDKKIDNLEEQLSAKEDEINALEDKLEGRDSATLEELREALNLTWDVRRDAIMAEIRRLRTLNENLTADQTRQNKMRVMPPPEAMKGYEDQFGGQDIVDPRD